jgi:hypothetical protein
VWQDTLDGMRELLARAAARAARGGAARHCVRCQVPLLAWEAREQQLGMCSCCLVEHARSLAARGDLRSSRGVIAADGQAAESARRSPAPR